MGGRECRVGISGGIFLTVGSPKTDYRFFSQKGLAFMSAGDKLRTAFVLTNSFLTE